MPFCCACVLSYVLKGKQPVEVIAVGLGDLHPAHPRRKTVTAMDVVYALKRQGRTLDGFVVEPSHSLEDMILSKRCF